jgi:hypothetical protein
MLRSSFTQENVPEPSFRESTLRSKKTSHPAAAAALRYQGSTSIPRGRAGTVVDPEMLPRE